MKLQLRNMGRRFALAGGLLAAGMLTGCGGQGELTAEAMQKVQDLEYREALAGFTAAAEAGENARLISRGQGIAYMGLTEYEQAIACFEQALAESSGFVQPIDYDLNYYLAAAYIKNGQAEDAEAVYDAILAMRSNEEDAYFLRGSVRLERGNYEGGKEDFDRVIAMDPRNYDRLIKIYETLEHYGYREVGKEYLNSALENAGGKMNDYDSGRMYYYLGDYQKASFALEKAREKGDAESYLYLGKSYEAMGDYNYAASVYNAWIAKDTTSAAIYNQLGLCAMAMKDYRGALDAFQTGMKIEGNPFMQTLSFNEIVAYEYLEEYQKAQVLLENYLRGYPDDEQAKREYQFLSTR